VKYVLAISGGVDSRVLLAKTARQEILTDARWPDDFVVAHFDHGIRGAESAQDAEFVRDLAADYGVKFMMKKGDLPANTSEELAREKRYSFLFSVAKKFAGAKIVTAHHRDDLAETITMNLIRGGGWRGLAPMNDSSFGAASRTRIVRPLLGLMKFEIISFANEHNLAWREDATNDSMRYFRNRVRQFLARQPENKVREIVDLYEKQKTLRVEIDREIAKVATLSRYFLIMIPENVAMEILAAKTNGELTRPQLKQVLLFVKTAWPNKKLNFAKIKILAAKREIVIKMC
jgi:tRNA(Ile)-lysidine synthetase-like protein